MTMAQVSEKYQIPMEILREYESWNLGGEAKKILGARQYDDSDIKRLSIVLTLREAGFTGREAERYMKLLARGEATEAERLKMINDRRGGTLDEIHRKEKQLDRLDYLRFSMQREGRRTTE